MHLDTNRESYRYQYKVFQIKYVRVEYCIVYIFCIFLILFCMNFSDHCFYFLAQCLMLTNIITSLYGFCFTTCKQGNVILCLFFRFTCTVCTGKYYSKRELAKHIRISHEKIKDHRLEQN